MSCLWATLNGAISFFFFFPQELTRLRWLNSRLGQTPDPPARFRPLVVSQNTVASWGAQVAFAPDTGLPIHINTTVPYVLDALPTPKKIK